MKFSEQWLREWVSPELSTEELAHQLTMAGLEVDAIDPAAAAFSGIVVGEVLEVSPHPDADKLRVTKVSVGGDEALDIVCGAANVRPGLKVPTAVVGAVLPGNFKIKKAKLRGVPSFGMLCSASELGLAESSEGLMELAADAPVGTDFRAYMQLDDNCIELGLTPNRGDCLSIAGIARETAVLNAMEVQVPVMEPIEATTDNTFAIKVSAPEACPRYISRVISGINNNVETPLWMQEKLRRCGVRSLSPVVDITNYVLLELGQPMHAFDADKLSGGIEVRMARAGERIELLNENEVELDETTLVIADDKAPLAIAGVMGGNASSVQQDTTTIVLESAFFAPLQMAGTARRYGLHTDSSHRFERGVDYTLQNLAVERASALLLEMCGGQAGPLVEVHRLEHLPKRESILLRSERVERILGVEIAPAEVNSMLQRLGMDLDAVDSGFEVIPPVFRFDIAREVDLIEEVARIHGYDNIPSASPQISMQMAGKSETILPLTSIRSELVARGYQEAISYSFIDPKLQKTLEPEAEAVQLLNPISQDMSVMRTNLWAGLLEAAKHNVHRQSARVRLFESGLKFVVQAGEIKQKSVLSGLVYGPQLPEQWDGGDAGADFYDVKSDLEALLALGGWGEDCEFSVDQHPALHPGQTASIKLDGQAMGWLGALHPNLEKPFGLTGRCYLFEMDLEMIRQRKLPKFSELSKFPAVRRDLAVVVEQGITAAQLRECVLKVAPESLRELKLFDIYVGEHIDSGRKSFAFGLTLQEQSRTLKDEEVEEIVSRIVMTLGDELGATLRD